MARTKKTTGRGRLSAKEVRNVILDVNNVPLSLGDIQTYEDIYVNWPKYGFTEVHNSVLPEAICKTLLLDDRVDLKMKELAESWLEAVKSHKVTPLNLGPDGTPADFDLVGKIGYPLPGEFLPRKTKAGPVDVETVRDAVKENIACSLQLVLSCNIPLQAGSLEIRDIYAALKNPDSLEDATFSCKWVFACIRDYMITAYFGSVEAFMRSLLRLKSEGKGKGQLITDDFNLATVKNVCPNDKDLCRMSNMLSILGGSDESLGGVYSGKLSEEHTGRRDLKNDWTFEEGCEAQAILDEFMIESCD